MQIEEDRVEILSGGEKKGDAGRPLCLMVKNSDYKIDELPPSPNPVPAMQTLRAQPSTTRRMRARYWSVPAPGKRLRGWPRAAWQKSCSLILGSRCSVTLKGWVALVPTRRLPIWTRQDRTAT